VNSIKAENIVETKGNTSARLPTSLIPNRQYVMRGGANAQMMEAMLYEPLKSRNGQQQIGNLLAHPNQKDLEYAAELLAAGKMKPVLAKQYPLAKTADAIRYMEAGRAQGKMVITM
jgi:NADPH:quinone reductase-like Zn-dependent oxidoreductase